MFLPDNENQRLEALCQYQILDTLAEEDFDDLAQSAVDIFQTPIAVISILDAQREWFKSKIGIDLPEIAINNSFGVEVVAQTDILIIADIAENERFRKNSVVINQPNLRFYAGIPLINADGFALGCLAIMDYAPRDLSLQEQAALKRLARQVIKLLESRKQQISLGQDGRNQILDSSSVNVILPNGQLINVAQEISARKQTELALQSQLERERLMRAVAQRIQRCVHLQDILDATVKEIKDLLKVDRVVVYQFAPDMSGKIVAESIQTGYRPALGAEIEDTCFQTGSGLEYRQGRKRAIANIYDADLTDCHIQLLEEFQVKANLVVPILLVNNDSNSPTHLWGLLVAHQCSAPRKWQEDELGLLEQLSIPIAIAIQQSTILEQAQNELIERQRAEFQLRSALAEKEVLLKEVHHRVKNNLQIVSGLLLLHSQTLKDPELIRTLRESQNRIESISLIHKNLYTSPNIGKLDIVEYINNLATSILMSYQIEPGRISLRTQISPIGLNVDQAIACGLIINELLSNSLKHAFPNQQVGIINIALQKIDNNVEMIVQDNGIGLPENLDWRSTDSLGLALVYDLVIEQLEGTISVERQPGTLFKIRFPY